MRLYDRLPLVVALLFVMAPGARAQTTPVDPSGHWEGRIDVPGLQRIFEFDLEKNSNGQLVGTLSNEAEHIKGLPLVRISVAGSTVTFGARTDQMMSGDLLADGTSMAGTATVSGYAIPFSAARTGNARVAVRPRSAAISPSLEGTWSGTVDENGKPSKVILTLSNQPDGTALGSIINVDAGGLELPLVITQSASKVTLEVKPIAISYSGTLNSAGNELAGTLEQGAVRVPLTFRRQDTDGTRR